MEKVSKNRRGCFITKDTLGALHLASFFPYRTAFLSNLGEKMFPGPVAVAEESKSFMQRINEMFGYAERYKHGVGDYYDPERDGDLKGVVMTIDGKLVKVDSPEKGLGLILKQAGDLAEAIGQDFKKRRESQGGESSEIAHAEPPSPPPIPPELLREFISAINRLYDSIERTEKELKELQKLAEKKREKERKLREILWSIEQTKQQISQIAWTIQGIQYWLSNPWLHPWNREMLSYQLSMAYAALWNAQSYLYYLTNEYNRVYYQL